VNVTKLKAHSTLTDMCKQLKRMAGTSIPVAKHPSPSEEAELSSTNQQDNAKHSQQAMAARRVVEVKLRSIEPDSTDTPIHFIKLVLPLHVRHKQLLLTAAY
jgi:hypothetical protein